MPLQFETKQRRNGNGRGLNSQYLSYRNALCNIKSKDKIFSEVQMVSDNQKSTIQQPPSSEDEVSMLTPSDGGDGISTGLQEINFSGHAREYFGIWIVNLLLSIITLGIYSAWAKVRRETYFKNNTKIFDTGLGYHATGGQILKGRLIAFIVLLVVNVISSFQPLLSAALFPVFLFLLPWILNNSMRFSARMTSYRNIRFNWHGTYWKTFWFLVIAPFIGLLSLGLLTPLISKSYYSYFARSHSYGITNFTSNPKVGEFYYAFLVGGIIPTIIFGCLTFILVTVGQGSSIPSLFGSASDIWAVAPIVFYAFIFSMVFIYPVLCRNLMVNSLTFGEILTFCSRVSPVKFVWIALSNLVVTIFSLGLLLPWAKIRMYRYISGATLVEANGDIESFVDEANSTQSSFGEALADFEGVEVSI